MLSVALWLFVMTSEKAELVLAAAGRVRRDSPRPGGGGGAARLAWTCSSTVSAPCWRASGRSEVRARVSLAGVRPGEVVVRLVPDQIAAPSGVTVLRVSPSRLRVTLEPGRAAAAGRRRKRP